MISICGGGLTCASADQRKRTGTFLNNFFNGYKKISFFGGGSGEAFVPCGA